MTTTSTSIPSHCVGGVGGAEVGANGVVGASVVVGLELNGEDVVGLSNVGVGESLDGLSLALGAFDAVGALDTVGELDGHSPNVVVSLVVNCPPLATTDSPFTLRL